jgi:Uncharacterized protein conserved in bacteria
MKKDELKKAIKKEIKSWSGASIYFYPAWECERMDVAGKFFALLGQDKEGNDILTVKGIPQENIELRNVFEWIVPGYYTNKDHWNSILLDKEQFGEEKLLGLLYDSYGLVVAKLPKKVRETLLEEK